MIFIAIGIKPTLTAFRYIFRLRRCTATQGLGWVTFQHRWGFFIVEGLRDTIEHFRNDFVFLYIADPWPVKTSHDEQPNFQFNNNVPQCNLEDFFIIEHATKEVELQGFKPVLVQRNFVVNLDHLQNDLFLSSLGLSPKYHQGELEPLLIAPFIFS